MGGEDGGDDAGDGDGEGVPLVVAAEGEEATVVEAERRGAPEMAPPLGEDLRGAGFPGGEAGDDVAEDVVREVPDEVAGGGLLITIIFFLLLRLRPPPLRTASFLLRRITISQALVRDQYGFLDMGHGRRVAWRQPAAARTEEGRRRGGKSRRGRSVRPKKTASSPRSNGPSAAKWARLSGTSPITKSTMSLNLEKFAPWRVKPRPKMLLKLL